MKSPTKDALHHELTSKTAAINHKDGTVVAPSSLKGVMTPRQLTATARDDSDADSLASVRHGAHTRNLNDVCFGCNGDCSDAACSSSKRSSLLSADVESNVADTPKHSPAHQLRDTHDPGGGDGQDTKEKVVEVNEDDLDLEVMLKNDNNMNVSQTESIFNENVEETENIYDSENGNNSSPVNSPAKPTSPKLSTSSSSSGGGGAGVAGSRSRNGAGTGSKRNSKRVRSAEGSQEALDDQQRPRKVSSTCYDSADEGLDQLNDLGDLPQHARVSKISQVDFCSLSLPKKELEKRKTQDCLCQTCCFCYYF